MWHLIEALWPAGDLIHQHPGLRQRPGIMETAYKFGTPEPENREWTYGDVWATEETTEGGSRLVIAPAQEQTEILAALLKDMTEPFWVLYVLVIPRGRGDPGRYQSPEPQTEGTVGTFLHEFSGFLQKKWSPQRMDSFGVRLRDAHL